MAQRSAVRQKGRGTAPAERETYHYEYENLRKPLATGQGVDSDEIDILKPEESSSSQHSEPGEAFIKDSLKKRDRMSAIVHDRALLER